MAIVNDYPVSPDTLSITADNDGSIVTITLTSGEAVGGATLSNVMLTAVYVGTSTYALSKTISSLAPAGTSTLVLSIDGEEYDKTKLHVGLAFVH